MAGLDDQTQVRRECTTVASTSGLLVGVRGGHVVSELARALEHLALVVRAVLVLDLLGQGLDLVSGVRYTYEVAPGDAVKRVTRSADFTVDLVSAANAVVRVG